MFEAFSVEPGEEEHLPFGTGETVLSFLRALVSSLEALPWRRFLPPSFAFSELAVCFNLENKKKFSTSWNCVTIGRFYRSVGTF